MNKQIGHPLRDWNELPEWIQQIYHKDSLIERTVKDWRMTNNSLETLFNRLAYQLLIDRDYWKKSYEQAAQNTPRIEFGE